MLLCILKSKEIEKILKVCLSHLFIRLFIVMFRATQNISFKVIISENMKNLKIVILGEGCAENEIFNRCSDVVLDHGS